MLQSERRRFHRVILVQPIRAFAGATPVQVVDASIAGLRVLHQNNLPQTGATCRVMFQSEFGPISVDCEVVHTVERRTKDFDESPTLQSGLRVLAADRQSQERLREMIAVLSTSRRNHNEH
ncbi:MAG TPA: PilZ domain-containing protein [Thermoanaerobaculia bacterium]|nr:PilZ domain-containing protein [Thermoanaerobaculia bacterium]